MYRIGRKVDAGAVAFFNHPLHPESEARLSFGGLYRHGRRGQWDFQFSRKDTFWCKRGTRRRRDNGENRQGPSF
jgi:hypothetical protein